jgi:tetratricopeptide (TPR) repeat protein
MRLFLTGVAAVAALAFTAPVARADDASLLAAAHAQQPHFLHALKRFATAVQVKRLRTHRGIEKAKSATRKLAAATQEYYNQVSVQQASTQPYADARQHLLIGLVRYKQALVLYRKALTAADHRKLGTEKAYLRLGVRRLKAAVKQFRQAQLLIG